MKVDRFDAHGGNNMKIICSTLFLSAIFLNSAGSAMSHPPAKWTIMVYMNGDNDLEPDTGINLNQIAKVGSSAEVNIVVQIARESVANVLRGLVVKRPNPGIYNPILDLKESLHNIDMAVPDTLYDFLKWGAQTYPAEHYAVIIWGHGAGWRKIVVDRSQTVPDQAVPVDERTAANDSPNSDG
jgi:hypothetical protein